jgi:hypothetical protein
MIPTNKCLDVNKLLRSSIQRQPYYMARTTTGMFPSTPLGPWMLIAESGLTPAIHLLNYRQSRYAQRLYQNPRSSARPKEIIEGKSQLAETLRKASQRGKETRIERVWNEDGLRVKGKIIVENAENAKQIGLESREDGRTTVWIDGSRMDDGNVVVQLFGG